jgi:hypothetical protein
VPRSFQQQSNACCRKMERRQLPESTPWIRTFLASSHFPRQSLISIPSSCTTSLFSTACIYFPRLGFLEEQSNAYPSSLNKAILVLPVSTQSHSSRKRRDRVVRSRVWLLLVYAFVMMMMIRMASVTMDSDQHPTVILLLLHLVSSEEH